MVLPPPMTETLDNTAGPVPTPTFTPIPTAALPDGPPVLFFYDGTSLSRTDVDGSAIQPIASPLTGAGDTVWLYFWANPPQVSPNGRWLITHASVSSGRANWQLVDVQNGTVTAEGHGQSRLSPTWAPDSQRFAYLVNGQLCIYSLLDKTDACMPIAGNLIGASWSPDGSTIAVAQANLEAACCTGTVWVFPVANGKAAVAGAFAAPPQATIEDIFMWLPGDMPALLIKTDPESQASTFYDMAAGTVTMLERQVRDISPDGRYLLYTTGEVGSTDGRILYALPANNSCPNVSFNLHNWDWSPENGRLAFLHSCAATPQTAWLIVLDVTTGESFWTREITGLETTFAPTFVYWTPDGQYLLLDEPEELFDGHRQLSPIWRILADGSGEVTAVVEHGFLLGGIPAWNQ
jgi:hypothetical protein